MLSKPVKLYFAQLPFNEQINYFIINPNLAVGDSFYSNESSENEFAKQNYNDTSSLYNKSNKKNDSSFRKEPILKRRQPKTSIKLNEDAESFQYSFYQSFTNKKKFPKKYVVLIHNAICNYLHLRRVSREESRSISLYFAHFAKNADEILLFVNNNKSKLLRLIPELQNV